MCKKMSNSPSARQRIGSIYRSILRKAAWLQKGLQLLRRVLLRIIEQKGVYHVDYNCQERQCFRLEEMAPNFKLPAYCRGKQIEVSLEDCRSCWTVLFFYSSDFTFV